MIEENGGSGHHWFDPIGLVVMLLVALVLALTLVRHHGRYDEWRAARAARKHPFDRPGSTLLAFAVAAASVIAFLRLAREVVAGATHGYDVRIALAVHALDGRAMDVVMNAFTFMGSAFAVIPLAAVVLVWAYRRQEYRAMLALVVVLSMTELLNVALKDTFSRARPTLFEKIATLHSYSFPSGHSMAAVATYGMVGIVLTRLDPRHRRFFVIGAPILIFMIGLSRVYLGVHWPTDVLAGFAAGGFLVLAGAIALMGVPLRRQRASDAPHAAIASRSA